MTTLGLDYLKHQEQSRSNLANERETHRANLAREGENLRHNTVTEQQAKDELAEKIRSNKRVEDLTEIRDKATKSHYERSDQANKEHYERMDDETQRNNVAKLSEEKRSNEMNELINNLKNTEGSSYYQTKLLGDQVYNKLISATSNPESKKYLQEEKAKLEKETNKRRYADRIYEMYKTIWGGASKAVGQAMGKS